MVQPHSSHYTSDGHFTYILDYMGESIAVQTVRPTRFKLLNLCFIASSALQNDESPPNYLFRPTCALSWLGHVVKLFSDDILQVMIHESIKRGDNTLYISVNFTPIDTRRPGPARELNSLPDDLPVIVDKGGRHRHPIVQHATHVHALPPTAMAIPARPAVPSMLLKQPFNGGQRPSEVQGNPLPQGLTDAPPQSEHNELHVNSPVQQLMEVAPTPLPVQADLGDNIVNTPNSGDSGKPPSGPKRMYKCQKYEGVGHSKRFCKVKKPASVRPESSASAEAAKREDNGQTVDIEAFPNVMHGDAERPMSTK
ncbi:hypothetical protein WN943_027392 [Citrus x changshan-huyou]